MKANLNLLGAALTIGVALTGRPAHALNWSAVLERPPLHPGPLGHTLRQFETRDQQRRPPDIMDIGRLRLDIGKVRPNITELGRSSQQQPNLATSPQPTNPTAGADAPEARGWPLPQAHWYDPHGSQYLSDLARARSTPLDRVMSAYHANQPHADATATAAAEPAAPTALTDATPPTSTAPGMTEPAAAAPPTAQGGSAGPDQDPPDEDSGDLVRILANIVLFVLHWTVVVAAVWWWRRSAKGRS